MIEEKSMMDYMGLGASKITIKDRLRWKYDRLRDFYCLIKWGLQRLFRSHHASDCDLWGLYDRLTSIILPKLKAFRKIPLHGYPSSFCEWDENIGMTKEEYDKAVKKGDVEGGESEAWLHVIDEMIFAFSFVEMDSFDEKKRAKFFKDFDIIDPHAKVPEHRKVGYAYKTKDGNTCFSHLPPGKEEKDWEYLGEDISYFNLDLHKEQYERVQNGLNLFAKHFMSLWD